MRPFSMGNAASALWPRSAVFALLVALAALDSVQAQQQQSLAPEKNLSAINPNRDSLSVRSLRAEPGKASLYDVTFVTTDTLASDAEIVIAFPPVFDLSLLEIAGSSEINGGFKLERKGREVRLRRTGLGDQVPPGRKVSVQLGMIVNPADLTAAHRVDVQLRSSSRLATAIVKNQQVQFISPVK
jgi:hypothetical protein